MNKDLVNDHTGILTTEADLVESLRYFRDNWQRYSPRQWALANISAAMTREKLNEELKAIAARTGEQWTVDIVGKVNAPEARYTSPSDADRLIASEQFIALFSTAKASSDSHLRETLTHAAATTAG